MPQIVRGREAVNGAARFGDPLGRRRARERRKNGQAAGSRRRLGRQPIEFRDVVQPERSDEPRERTAREPAGILDEEAASGVAVRLDEPPRVDRRTVMHGPDDFGRAEARDDAPRRDDSRTKRIGEIVTGADGDGDPRLETRQFGAARAEHARDGLRAIDLG